VSGLKKKKRAGSPPQFYNPSNCFG